MLLCFYINLSIVELTVDGGSSKKSYLKNGDLAVINSIWQPQQQIETPKQLQHMTLQQNRIQLSAPMFKRFQFRVFKLLFLLQV